jgi:MoaA/NifB/PqqE/SkfB family radical SAM enzyme
MRIRDVPQAFGKIVRHPLLVRLVVTGAARLAVHPLERRLPGGWSLPPRSIQVMVTDTCNFSCRMCQYAHSESPDYALRRAGLMPLEVFRRVVSTTPGHPLVALTGGEPLLHPEIAEFIRLAKGHGLPCALTTNGWFLEERAADLCAGGLDLLVVSIDGDEAVHDDVRQPGAFARATAGIREIQRHAVRPIVTISCAVSDMNAHALERLHELAVSLGIDALNFNHLWIQSDAMVAEQRRGATLPKAGRVTWAVQLQSINPERIHDSIGRARRLPGRLLVNAYPELSREETDLYYREPERLVKETLALCAWLQIRVWPNGDVRMCRESSCGNVLQESLATIWNNGAFRAFRGYLQDHGVCPICSRCCYFFMRV